MKLTTFVSCFVALAAMLTTSLVHATDWQQLERDADTAVRALHKKYPAAQQLRKTAKGVLVFPKITKVGLMIGGETGDGVLRVGGKTVAYYNTSGVSYGMQIGAQTYGYVLVFMTDEALKSLDATNGFEVGVGPSIVVMDDAMAKKTTSTSAQADIYAFVFANKGLMAGLGVQGNKITKLK